MTRQAAIDAIFPGGWPLQQPLSIVSSTSPIVAPGTFQAIDTGIGKVGLWTPANPGGGLLVACQGHGLGLDAIGLGEVIRAAIFRGMTVLGRVMPGGSDWVSGTTASHSGLPLSAFVEPIAIALNAVDPNGYSPVLMTGISGGGWAATLYPALDARITYSVPVSGSYPLSIPEPTRDAEQLHSFWTDTLTYEQAYALAGGNGKQIQVLGQYDTIFTGNGSHLQYEATVKAEAQSLGGDFEVVIDGTYNGHKISQHTLETVLVPLMGGTQPMELILDNAGPEFSASGNFVYHRTGEGYNNSIHHATTQDGSHIFEWTASATGDVEIRATWSQHPNRADNTAFDVFDGPTLVQTFVVNQRLAPSGQVYGGKAFQLLGVVPIASGMLRVRITDTNSPTGFVIADAIRIVASGDPPDPPDPPPSGTVTYTQAQVDSIRAKLDEIDTILDEGM